MKLNKLYPLSDELYAKLVFIVLAAMIVAMPSSRFLMSVSQFSFGALWLAHGRYREKWDAFIKNPAAILLTSFYLMHIIGVFYSTDINYALKDIRIKLPILIIPFMFSGFPKLNDKQFEKLIFYFIGSVLLVSIIVSIIYLFTKEELRYIIGREFVSHIRYSLSLNLAIFYLFLLYSQKRIGGKLKYLFVPVILWLFYFLFFLEAFTGIVVFVILVFVMLGYFAFNSGKKITQLIYIVLFIAGGLGIAIFLNQFLKKHHHSEPIEVSSLDQFSPYGNLYIHEPEQGTENGKYLYLYICNKELEKAWNERSEIPFDSLDAKGQRLKYTMYRYLTSLDLRKDKDGIDALSEQDIRNIENGIANIHYTKGIGIKSRLLKIIFEYENYLRTGNPSGHSVMQRVEYWKTGWSIVQKNFWIGVGTGDMDMVFKEEYNLLNSKLTEEARRRAHNQYLSIWIGFGLIGLIWFLIVVFYPPFALKRFENIYFSLFYISFVVSMLTEDTIETQAGVTFFILFSSIFLILIDSHQKPSLKEPKL
jgi:hypothetical protein